MKKELCAGTLVFLLFIGAIWNIFYLDRLAGRIETHIDRSRQACMQENFSTAEQELRRSLEIWLQADAYTHVFIRHTEIDALSDAFYDTLSCLTAQDRTAATGAYEKLLSHLDNMVFMEHVTARSVF